MALLDQERERIMNVERLRIEEEKKKVPVKKEQEEERNYEEEAYQQDGE